MGERPNGYEPPEDEFSNEHYSDKGSHRARSEFWKDARRGIPTQIFPDKDLEQLINRPTKDDR
jgi:hypothetical protein